MARSEESRTVTLSFKATPAEALELRNLARASGEALSAWLRRMAFSPGPAPPPELQHPDEAPQQESPGCQQLRFPSLQSGPRQSVPCPNPSPSWSTQSTVKQQLPCQQW